MENIEEDTIEKLNDEWIYDFENTDKLYQDFYKDNLYYTTIHFIYISKTNEINKIKKENFLMSKPNCITREEIVGILKRNSFDDMEKKGYSLLSILKYNISLNVEEMNDFLHCKEESLDNYNMRFLVSVKNIDTIYFEKSIHMFHDLNEVFILFYEKSDADKNNTRPMTRKIYLQNKSRRKTIKKQYKD